MKRLALLMLVCAIAVVSIALCGCGNKITTETDKGTQTSEESEELPTEEELGVPLYPGAKVYPESSGKITTTTQGDTKEFIGVNLVTNDAYPEVVAWYREKLSGMPGFVDMTASSGSENTLFSVGSGQDGRIVGIDKDASGNTKISIASSF